MFGIIYGIVNLIGRTIFDINIESGRLSAKSEALKNGKDYYFDNRGAMWYCGNRHDERCIELYSHNVQTGKFDCKNGHHVLVSFNDGKILKDYTNEQNKKEDNEFYNKYNEAMNIAIINGQSYFYVNGLTALDKRFGYYELETGKYYELGTSYNNTKYYKRYYDVSKNTKKLICSTIIQKDEFIKLGGSGAIPYRR